MTIHPFYMLARWSAGPPQQEASSDEREDANRHATGHARQKTRVVKHFVGRTHKISMQKVSEGQRREQHCNSAQKVKNSHVALVNARQPVISQLIATTSPIRTKMLNARPHPARAARRPRHRNRGNAILPALALPGSLPRLR